MREGEKEERMREGGARGTQQHGGLTIAIQNRIVEKKSFIQSAISFPLVV